MVLKVTRTLSSSARLQLPYNRIPLAFGGWLSGYNTNNMTMDHSM